MGANILADKFAIFNNAAQFAKTDPIFGADIGYYMFSLPFIQTLLIFIINFKSCSHEVFRMRYSRII